MRKCRVCGEFAVRNPHGFATCPNCRDKKRKQRVVNYKINHKDNSKERTARWRNTKQGKEYIKSTKFRCSMERYLSTPKGKAMVKRRDAKRRANLRLTDCNVTADEWFLILEKYQNKCVYCGKESEMLTMDHFVPLAEGGTHTKENVVPACRSCNSSKGRKLMITDGFGNFWPAKCPMCKKNKMQVVRPGKVQCSQCG